MIPRKAAWICLDCDLVMRPTQQGRCEFCGSEAIYPLVRVIERTPKQEAIRRMATEAVKDGV